MSTDTETPAVPSVAYMKRLDKMLAAFEAKQHNEYKPNNPLPNSTTPCRFVQYYDFLGMGTINSPAQATAYIHNGPVGEALTDTERSIEVMNRNNNYAVLADDYGWVIRSGGEWQPLPFPSAMWNGEATTTITDTASGTVDVTGSDWNLGNVYSPYGDIEVGQKVLVVAHRGTFIVIQARCP